jgi:hypothetical protein
VANWQKCIDKFIMRAVTGCIAGSRHHESEWHTYKFKKANAVIYPDNLLIPIKPIAYRQARYSTFELYHPGMIDVHSNVRAQEGDTQRLDYFVIPVLHHPDTGYFFDESFDFLFSRKFVL